MKTLSSRTRSSRVAALLAITALTACGGGGSTSLPATSNGAHALGKTTLTLRVKGTTASPTSTVRRTTIASAGRKPQYLSPSTQSLVYVISQNGTPVSGGSGYVNLTTASSYCSSAGAAQPLVCSTQVPVAITATGSYTFNVATYDAQQTAQCTPGATPPTCAGNVLSNQSVLETLTLDTANSITLDLGGDVASLAVSPLAPGYLRGDMHGLKLWGPNAQTLTVDALDADGNAIVSPGAPAIALTSGSSTLTATPVTNQPGLFKLQAQTSGGLVTPGTVNLTVALTAPTTGGGSVPANTTVPVTIAHSIIYISDGNSTVYEYEDGATTTATTTITNGVDVPIGVAVDANGTLYVANFSGDDVAEYPAGSTTATTTITNGVNFPYGVAVDANGTLYVANGYTVTEYPAGSTTAATTIPAGLNGPEGVAVDASGTLYVANYDNSTVMEYPAGSTTAATTIMSTSGLNGPAGIAVDANGTLYVANNGNNTVTEYPAGSTTLTTTITNGLSDPIGVAVDANGTLYVANNGNNTVTEYPAGSTTGATAITLGTDIYPYFIAVVPASVQP